MFLRIIIFLILVATISLGINWMVENNGTVEFIWLGYQIKTSTSFAIFALAFTIVAMVIIVQVLITLFAFPKKIGKKYQNHQLDQNLKQLQIGYAALLSGDHEQAKRASQRLIASKPKKKSLSNMSDMLAAKVAQEEGNLTIANEYYSRFLGNKKQKFFAVKAMLDTSFQQGNIEDAISYAEEAYELKPNVKDGARSLLELYKKSGRYVEAEDFLNKYNRRHRIFKDRHNVIDVKKELAEVWLLKANELIENDKSFNITDKNDIKLAQEYLEKIIKYEPYNKEVVVKLMKIYQRLKLEKRATQTVAKIWPNLQSYDIGAAYLDVFSGNAQEITKKKLKAIENLKKISHNGEIIEKLKDNIYDVRIKH